MTDHLINCIKDNFSKKRALFAGIALLFSVCVFVDDFLLKFIPNTNYRGGGYLLFAVAWVGYWLYSRNSMPRNPKGEIGIVVCVETENDKQLSRLRNDFIQRIKDQVAQKRFKRRINVILLTNYQASCVIEVLTKYAHDRKNAEAAGNWEKLKNKIGGHFYIFGKIKERSDGEKKYFLNLEALVTHAPVQLTTQEEIERDFVNVWHREISFQERVEFRGFKFAADSIFVAVQYIVGIAALVSNDVFLAFDLHSALDADPNFTVEAKKSTNLSYIKRKLKSLCAEECRLISRHYYVMEEHEKAEEYADKSLRIEQNYSAYIQKALIEFVFKNNPHAALENVRAAKLLAREEGTWRYNEAFLLMYLERFAEAIQVYHDIVAYSYQREEIALNEVYKFNEKLLGDSPEKVQAHFIIGFLKYKKDGNCPCAVEHLEKFIEKSRSHPKYKLLRDMAEKYVEEINTVMKL